MILGILIGFVGGVIVTYFVARNNLGIAIKVLSKKDPKEAANLIVEEAKKSINDQVKLDEIKKTAEDLLNKIKR